MGVPKALVGEGRGDPRGATRTRAQAGTAAIAKAVKQRLKTIVIVGLILAVMTIERVAVPLVEWSSIRTKL